VCVDFVKHDPRLLIRFFWHRSSGTLKGTVEFTDRAEGPPGFTHGGAVMLLFDECLAYPIWRSGTTAFTVNLNINLR
jgi:acyl-coenzyme A thioesterase PaaI-like protein